MEKDEKDLNFEKKLNDISESIRQSDSEHEKKLLQTRYYEKLVLKTSEGKEITFNNVFITVERNKEGDMEYHFRWAKENEQGEMTIDEKMMAKQNGDVYLADNVRNDQLLKEYLENSKIDMKSILAENDKQKGRLLAVADEENEREEERDKEKEAEEQPKNEEQEEKKAEEDLKKDDEEIEISKFRRIKDNHLQERMPKVFNNSSDYAIAYSATLGSFVVLEAKEEINEKGELSKTWKVNENVQTAGTNYRSIISADARGEKLERKVPYALLRTNDSQKEIAITLEAQNYGELDIETVDVMPCQERFARPVRVQGEGIEGQESLDRRMIYERSGTSDGVNAAEHDAVHGAIEEEQEKKESGENIDPSQITEETPITIPGVTYEEGEEFSYGDLAKIKGETVQDLVREKGQDNEKFIAEAKTIYEQKSAEAKEQGMKLKDYIKIFLLRSSTRSNDDDAKVLGPSDSRYYW